MLLTVKPASCKISINPFEISTSSILWFFLFTVSSLFIDDDNEEEKDSDNCEVEPFMIGLLFYYNILLNYYYYMSTCLVFPSKEPQTVLKY
jgi:hypothetical protein